MSRTLHGRASVCGKRAVDICTDSLLHAWGSPLFYTSL